ncbi:LOW QUALITY PROTEIN: hypothetical protein PHMEG_00010055 [Phytophthora megakarya]|uniref:Uncharacterized protein n=1 Tax=Phytophthora megakarya TaxID=4795 RepID=A0A225WEM2_9STRA|nr:LOW QUALITY PROTEIN: hypothetical protein PHMEG_00010055 [Phytophthora megakarya]
MVYWKNSMYPIEVLTRASSPKILFSTWNAIYPVNKWQSESVNPKMADGRVVRCFEEVLLDIELVTIAGPVAIQSVACVILPGEGDNFQLGHCALKALGIDVQDQLAQPPVTLPRRTSFRLVVDFVKLRNKQEMRQVSINYVAASFLELVSDMTLKGIRFRIMHGRSPVSIQIGGGKETCWQAQP